MKRARSALGIARSGGFVAAMVATALALGCGYHTPSSAESGRGFSVAAAPARSPHVDAVDAALAGARDELAHLQALSSSGYPELVIEILRVDELPAALQAADVGGGRQPLARGSAIGVVGRAWVRESPDGPPLHDTGDVRRVETVVQGGEVVAAEYAYAEAVRAAARRLGAALVRRATGQAEPSIEPM